jgi:hypothetical protein
MGTQRKEQYLNDFFGSLSGSKCKEEQYYNFHHKNDLHLKLIYIFGIIPYILKPIQ